MALTHTPLEAYFEQRAVALMEAAQTTATVARLPFYDPGRGVPRWDESVVR